MYVYNAEVLRWIDGDTVVVNIDVGFGIILRNRSVRLYGIDAPESRTRDLSEKRRGLEAKAYCERTVPYGSKIQLKTYKTGKYGRILGEVIHEGVNINQVLIEEGHAVKY